MNRLRALNRYQKCILLCMAVMVLAFSIIYPAANSREGFAYQKAILLPREENGSTVYAGKIHGIPASFTVTAGKAVVFQYGEQTYGPYTAEEDPDAVPKDAGLEIPMTGIILRSGEHVIFHGGMTNINGTRWLYNNDGTPSGIGLTFGLRNGVDEIVMDQFGNKIDKMEPTASTILDLMEENPPLSHKGEWPGWFCGVGLCLATAISILFANDLFRWNLRYRIRHAELAEPSEWEIAGRYIAWTIMPILAAVVFVLGLQFPVT